MSKEAWFEDYLNKYNSRKTNRTYICHNVYVEVYDGEAPVDDLEVDSKIRETRIFIYNITDDDFENFFYHYADVVQGIHRSSISRIPHRVVTSHGNLDQILACIQVELQIPRPSPGLKIFYDCKFHATAGREQFFSDRTEEIKIKPVKEPVVYFKDVFPELGKTKENENEKNEKKSKPDDVDEFVTKSRKSWMDGISDIEDFV